MDSNNHEIDDNSSITNSITSDDIFDKEFFKKIVNNKDETETISSLPSCHCPEERRNKQPDGVKFNIEIKEKDTFDVLDPNHPALQKFQNALKEHLVKQISHLNEEIGGYEAVIKQKNAQKDEIGVSTYELQQVVCKQQKMLEEYIENLNSATAAREQLEYELKEHKENYKKESDRLYQCEKEEKQLRNEAESINLLLQQTANWEKDIESEITISKRMTEKTKKDHRRLMTDKKKQDMILYMVQTEVWRLETDLETIDMKLAVKEREREEIAQRVAEGNTTIEALEAEYRCLMHSWNSVIVAISNRDKVMNCINQELKKYQEDHKNILCEIEQIRKLTKHEMTENEKLTSIKQRILYDIQTCKNRTSDELSKQKKLEKKLIKLQSILDQTEYDINKVSGENVLIEASLTILRREFEKQHEIKIKWEEKLFSLLEDETTNSKAAQNLATRYRHMKSSNRKVEITLALSENKNAIIQTKYESQLNINSELSRLIGELNTQKLQLEKELGDLQDQLKTGENYLLKRQRVSDKLYNKLMEVLAGQGGKEISASELKIKTLEKNIEMLKENIKELQVFWMREQRNVINLSETRQEQISNNDLLRKQILILQQKNLRITDEIESIKKQDQKTSRSILNLHNQILMKSDALSKRLNEKKTLDAYNDLCQAMYMSKLKDLELECLKLEADIEDIEDDKLTVSKQLLDINREVLEWEKKLKIIVDTKKQIEEEKSSEGEIGKMKLEVHKMEVRYNQLKKAQDKLMTDLEFCVHRREAIVAGSEAREKRSKFGIEKTRVNFKRKIDDTRNKLKQLETESHQIKNRIQKLKEDKQVYEKDVLKVQNEVDDIRKIIENVLNEYENLKTEKILQFELLIMKQKKMNIFSDLSRGKKVPFIYKNECILKIEYEKNEETNNKLITIVETLVTHFPHYKHYFNRIMNTLKYPKELASNLNLKNCFDYNNQFVFK